MGMEICLRRGNGILDRHENYREIVWSVNELDYTESLVTWHIATEFCFHEEDCNSSENMDYRKISKSLSDYMFYLLEVEPAIMGTVSMDRRVVREATYCQIKGFINGQSSFDGKNVSRAIFAISPEFDFMSPIGRKPVFLYARKLTHQLKELDESIGFPWELMSKVWVELMCYAAINGRPNVHAQQPSRGGQLLTIVWLLMNWFGLGTQFATERHDVV